MTGLWAVFDHPMIIPSSAQLWLLLPLCLSVAIIYKTVRTDDPRKLWWQVIAMMGYLVGGLILLGAVLWLLFDLATRA